MLPRLCIPVLLRHPGVDDMDKVRVLSPRPVDEEVIGLDIPVDEVLVVDRLYAGELE